MNLLSILLGISLASGLSVYATVFAMGLLQRFGIIHLPSTLEVVSSLPVMIVAAGPYAIEFVVDKVPILDSAWDGIHTVIRPAAGAILAYSAVGHVDPQLQLLAALLGGSLAFAAHAAKSSARAAVQVSPEPVSNWILSLVEDGLVFVLVWLVGSHPWIGLVVAVAVAILAIVVAWKLSRFFRRVLRRLA